LIAAILMVSSVKMVPVGDIVSLCRNDKVDFLLLFFVWFLCLQLNGAEGLVAGIVLAFLKTSMH